MRKVNEMVRTNVSEIISRELELGLDVFVTITTVKTAPDLKTADVYITIIPDGKRISTLKSLQARAKHIQRELGKRIRMKYTPALTFHLDEGEIKRQQINELLGENASSPEA